MFAFHIINNLCIILLNESSRIEYHAIIMYIAVSISCVFILLPMSPLSINCNVDFVVSVYMNQYNSLHRMCGGRGSVMHCVMNKH